MFNKNTGKAALREREKMQNEISLLFPLCECSCVVSMLVCVRPKLSAHNLPHIKFEWFNFIEVYTYVRLDTSCMAIAKFRSSSAGDFECLCVAVKKNREEDTAALLHTVHNKRKINIFICHTCMWLCFCWYTEHGATKKNDIIKRNLHHADDGFFFFFFSFRSLVWATKTVTENELIVFIMQAT